MSAERLVRQLRGSLAEAGLAGSFLVRDVADGQEIGIDPDLEYPAASLVKVPLAVAVHDRVHRGELDPAAVQPAAEARMAQAARALHDYLRA